MRNQQTASAPSEGVAGVYVASDGLLMQHAPPLGQPAWVGTWVDDTKDVS